MFSAAQQAGVAGAVIPSSWNLDTGSAALTATHTASMLTIKKYRVQSMDFISGLALLLGLPVHKHGRVGCRRGFGSRGFSGSQ